MIETVPDVFSTYCSSQTTAEERISAPMPPCFSAIATPSKPCCPAFSQSSLLTWPSFSHLQTAQQQSHPLNSPHALSHLSWLPLHTRAPAGRFHCSGDFQSQQYTSGVQRQLHFPAKKWWLNNRFSILQAHKRQWHSTDTNYITCLNSCFQYITRHLFKPCYERLCCLLV